MENKRLSKERIAFLSRSVWSEIDRYDANAGNLFVDFFLSPFQDEQAHTHWHEQAQTNSVKRAYKFSPRAVDADEFNLVVEIFREIARQLPEAYHMDEVPVTPLDQPSKIVGWFDKGKVHQYWTQGRDEHPLRRIANEVLTKQGIA